MTKSHLKRLSTPRTWNIKRKENKFVVRPHPGGHSRDLSISITVFFKDLINQATTTKEVKYILHEKEVLINGTRKKDNKMPVGFLDVISIPSTKEHYRILLSEKNKLMAVSIDAKEADMQLLKLVNKINRGKKLVQLVFATGASRLVDAADYKTGDSILVKISKNEIIDHLPMQKGAPLLIFKGKHQGKVAIFDSVNAEKVVCTFDKQQHEIYKKFVLVIGKDKPLITLQKKK